MAARARPSLSKLRDPDRRQGLPRLPSSGRRLSVLLPGGHPPLAQQARIFAENRRWIEAGCRLRPDLPDLEGVQRLLFRHYGELVGHWQAAAAGEAPALHEVRIALRRMGTILRAFRKRLRPTSARELRRHLRKLNRALGPARDLDDWLEFLREQEAVAADDNGYLAGLTRQRRQVQRAVRRLLSENAFRSLQSRFDPLLRVELPQLRNEAAPVPLARAAGLVLLRQWRRVRRLGRRRRTGDGAALHRWRIALRRLRYLGEMLAPVLGEPVGRLGKRAHAVERLVAQLRDSSRDLARFSAEEPPPPRVLRRLLRRRRKEARAALAEAWSRFEDRDFRRAAKAALAGAA